MKYLHTMIKPEWLMLIITLVSVVFSFYLYQEKKTGEAKEYSLTTSQSTLFVVDKTKIQGESSGGAESVRMIIPPNWRISVDGKLQSKVAIDRIRIFNSGSSVIAGEDFIEPISVGAPEGIQILSVKVVGKGSRWTPIMKDNAVVFPKLRLNVGEVVLCDISYSFEASEWQKKWDWNGNVERVSKITYTPNRVFEELKAIDENPVYFLKKAIFEKEGAAPLAVMLFGYEVAIMLLVFTLILWSTLLFLGVDALKQLKNIYLLIIIIGLAIGAMASAEILTFIFTSGITPAPVIYKVWLPCIGLHLLCVGVCNSFVKRNTLRERR